MGQGAGVGEVKTTIRAIVLSVSLCTTAYILNRNFHDYTLLKRIAKAETKIAVLQDRFEISNKNAEMVIAEVRDIVTTAYSHIIPIRGGLLAIKEEP